MKQQKEGFNMEKDCKIVIEFGFVSNQVIATEFISNEVSDAVLSIFGITRENIEHAYLEDDAEKYIESLLEKDNDAIANEQKGKRVKRLKKKFLDGKLRESTYFTWKGDVYRQDFYDEDEKLHCEDGPSILFPMQKYDNERYYLHGEKMSKEEFEEIRMLEEIPINNIPNKKPVSF